jgi:flagellar hook assembly protein FlgD
MQQGTVIGIPDNYSLSQNYPNPFNAETIIKYQLPKSGKVKLQIYDIAGRMISTLVNGEQKAGYYVISWDCRNSAGQGASSGIYFFRINAGDFMQTKKLLLIR